MLLALDVLDAEAARAEMDRLSISDAEARVLDQVRAQRG